MALAAVVTVVAGFVGLGVLFALGWRLFQQVRSLARTVGDSSQRIAEASAANGNPTDEGAATNVW
jgi:hypothetical protein